ncbi:dTDP-4-dehydrorhamnose reductase family protein [Metabacillus idriensis]|uniref:dTDP-4-dehydrorhamnose reductase family protein n=1 Tax=Metabacillus idriensis TaxID=324768 RepID=UPI00174AE210|nr:SDR family oxidoreductase [Metabacillus idriensis]
MKLLILGGKGMAGHMMVDYFKSKPGYDVFYTSRDLNDAESIYLNATDFDRIETIISILKPNIVINCIGILNQQAENNPLLAFQVNSVLPHQLAKLTEQYNGKLIQISTDCVFSGEKGDYTEDDKTDGTSVYAHSKYLGEIKSDKHLTIRTSIIGPELKDNGIGLFLWITKQSGEINGYTNVMWNGVTTLELAKATEWMILNHATGIYQLGGKKKISKHELLLLIQKTFGLHSVKINSDGKMVSDRTIKSTRTDFQYRIPSYGEMLIELKDWMDNKPSQSEKK